MSIRLPASQHSGSLRSWSGLTTSAPVCQQVPGDATDVARAVLEAASAGTTIKMPGTGHSFTDIAQADGVLLRPDRLRGITHVDREAMTVTALAGTTLHELNSTLEHLGLSLHNMGDIAEQTVAGATSTGTHGTGGVWASLSAQVAGLDLVTADGRVLHVSASENPDIFAVARIGLGALGIITALTFMVEPMFTLEAQEGPARWEEALASFDQNVAENRHFEMYWFPHTDRLLTKRNNRTLDDPQPLGRFRGWLDDEFLSNSVFGAVNRVGNLRPSLIPRINAASAQALSARTYSDVPHRVFTSPRTVRFREMEYALPRAAGLDALREVRKLLDRSGWTISFPVEVRVAPADDVALSTAADRDSLYLAFHVNAQTDHRTYFGAVEEIMRSYEGRPHWGKLHTLGLEQLAASYPRFAEFQAVRDRLDPDRLFANPYLTRVLGP